MFKKPKCTSNLNVILGSKDWQKKLRQTGSPHLFQNKQPWGTLNSCDIPPLVKKGDKINAHFCSFLQESTGSLSLNFLEI